MFSNKVGIGLRIVKNAMDLHHGTVNLDSTLGKGSTFTLLIPEEMHILQRTGMRLLVLRRWRNMPSVTGNAGGRAGRQAFE